MATKRKIMNTKEKLNLFTDAIAIILVSGVIVGIFYYYFQPNNKVIPTDQTINTKRENSWRDNENTCRDSEYCHSNNFQIFEKFGFAIKAPCKLEDISRQASGDFILNYGGITDKNTTNMTFYQLMANRLPVGYKNVSTDKLKNLMKDTIKEMMKNFHNCTPVLFGYEEYIGYVGECTQNGYKQKGVMFWKENYIICLTVISNDNLEEKFNKFTNSFKTIKTKNIQKEKHQINIQKLMDIGYSVYVPCELKQSYLPNYDYYYSGAIDGENKDQAIVYKIMVNKLPMPYSKMNNSDKKTIKKNLINYLQTKDNYTPVQMEFNCHFAFSANSIEQGFIIKECLVLSDEAVLEFIIFSKKETDEEFKKYINNIKPIR